MTRQTPLRRWLSVARRIRVPAGFLFVALYFWMARPTLQSLLMSLLLVIPGILVRGYASGHVKKNAELTVSGPYAHTRNPLYLGSALIAFGFALAARSFWIAVLLAALFIAIYWPVILGEEEYLRAHFTGFNDYAARVPRFFPRPWVSRNWDRGEFSLELYRKHREYDSLLGSLCIYLGLVALFLYGRGR